MSFNGPLFLFLSLSIDLSQQTNNTVSSQVPLLGVWEHLGCHNVQMQPVVMPNFHLDDNSQEQCIVRWAKFTRQTPEENGKLQLDDSSSLGQRSTVSKCPQGDLTIFPSMERMLDEEATVTVILFPPATSNSKGLLVPGTCGCGKTKSKLKFALTVNIASAIDALPLQHTAAKSSFASATHPSKSLE